MLSKPLSTLDYFYNKSHGMIQLVLKYEDKTKMAEGIDKLTKNVLGFHLKTDEHTYYYKKSKVDPIKVPDIQDLQELATFVYENHSPDFTDSLAKLCYNTDTLILNIGHLVADGGYFHEVVKLLTSENYVSNHNAILPDDIEENFKAQINSKLNEQCPYIFTDPDMIRINAPIANNKRKYAKHYHITLPVESLKCYDKNTNKVKGLTEALWTSYIISASSLNDKITNSGIATCIDMRNYLPYELKRGLSVCNHYSNITPASDLNPKMTIEEIGKRMRKDFNDKIKKGHHYTFLKSLAPPGAKKIPGIGLELSNIGRIKIKSPLKDVFIKSSVVDANCDPLISHSSFSVDSQYSNTLHGMFRYKSSVIGDNIVKVLSEGVKFALQNVSNQHSLEDSISLVHDYQKSLNIKIE